jgi:hypothetical protein
VRRASFHEGLETPRNLVTLGAVPPAVSGGAPNRRRSAFLNRAHAYAIRYAYGMGSNDRCIQRMLFHTRADALRERLDAIQAQIYGSGASGGSGPRRSQGGPVYGVAPAVRARRGDARIGSFGPGQRAWRGSQTAIAATMRPAVPRMPQPWLRHASPPLPRLPAVRLLRQIRHPG